MWQVELFPPNQEALQESWNIWCLTIRLQLRLQLLLEDSSNTSQEVLIDSFADIGVLFSFISNHQKSWHTQASKSGVTEMVVAVLLNQIVCFSDSSCAFFGTPSFLFVPQISLKYV